MDVPSSSKGKKKATEDDTKREPNWTAEETVHLLNAIQQIQTARGYVGFSFNKTEYSAIYDKFVEAVEHTIREKGKLVNSTKVILKMFRVCRELSNRSGGGWDEDTHRPIAPSEAEYVEMVKAKGEKGKFFLRNNFPWFRQMESMVGGQTSRGEIRRRTYGAEQRNDYLLTDQMSIEESEQGSSDEPHESNQQGGGSDSVHPPVRGARSSYTGDARGSDASFTKTNGSSGKKRKSTDDSSEPSSKAKTFKDRYMAKKLEQIRLAEAGLELARVFDKATILKMSVQEQQDMCMARFDEWGIVGRYHDFCMDQIENNASRRRWFLNHDKHVVVEWVERSVGFSMPTPNPVSNTFPNQSYSQPNPAFNYPFINPNP